MPCEFAGHFHARCAMFKFSIRDVLWLTALVGVGVGWWLNWSAMSKEKAGQLQVQQSLQNDLAKWKLAAGQIQRRSNEWERSAIEQRLRADYVSDQLYYKTLLKACPRCGFTIPPMAGKPWTPPEDSHWLNALPANAKTRPKPKLTP